MPKYWRISDRAIKNGQPSSVDRGPITYWVGDTVADDGTINWQRVTSDRFQKLLVAASDDFPSVEAQEDQPHVTFLIHGYNVGWQAASRSYKNLCDRLFTGDDSMGLCVGFDWPSYGNVVGYYPDRAHARACAQDLTDILSSLFDWLVQKQSDALNAAVAAAKGKKARTEPCKAKVSVISHSMGNYVMQKAMAAAWTRKNQPLLVSLVNQLLMVAADVDNNLFDLGAPGNDDGAAIANLSYRITALYSGRDAVLGASAGLKHFGIRRLGRSGLPNRPPLSDPSSPTDNVWDVDCSSFFPTEVNGTAIHGAYFVTDSTINLMRHVMRGLDRGVLDTLGYTKSTAWR